MAGETLMVTVGLVVTLFLTFATPQVINVDSECRMCPAECQSIPRSDGSCAVCICDGVALPDCPKLQEECPRDCAMQRNADGCNECVCSREEPVVCPPLPPCPEECQQLMDENGCPSCLCDAPPRGCPPITCPDGCTEEVGEDGCLSCRCQRTEICPAVQPCLRGCIDMDESGCFVCNCSLVSDNPTAQFDGRPTGGRPYGGRPTGGRPYGGRPTGGRPFGGNPFGVGPLGLSPFIDDSFELDRDAEDIPLPMARCRSERLNCPPGCRVVVASHGCRECICGDDAFLCPGVPSCALRCLFRSSEDRCCHCNCTEPATGMFSITMVRIPSFKPFRQFEHFGPFKPFGGFGGFGAFGPHREFGRNPFLPPLFPGRSDSSCTVDPATCNPGCRVIIDSDGCSFCQCPGDLCPRIRCPPRCVKRLGPNGCPECDCGGRPEPMNPDTEPLDSADPVDPAAPAVPMNPGIPLIPAEPVSPDNPLISSEPVFPTLPVVPEEPMNPIVPLMPIDPSAPLPAEPVAPAVPADPVVPAEPVVPAVPADPVVPAEPTDPILPASPAEPDTVVESNLPTQPETPVDTNIPDESNIPDETELPSSSGVDTADASVNPDAENLIPMVDVPEPRDPSTEAEVSP